MAILPATAVHPVGHVEVGLRVDHRPAHTVAASQGEIDTATAPGLREQLLGMLRHTTRSLVLDLSEVRCDASGLAVLIATQRRATLMAITLCLADPQPPVAKMLRVTGLNRCLCVHPKLTDALAPGEAGQAGADHLSVLPASRQPVTAFTAEVPGARAHEADEAETTHPVRL